MSWQYPPSLALARQQTPLVLLSRLSEQLGTDQRLWLKRDDLTGCATSGNKIRKLEFLLADARARGADTLVTCGGIQSNHARATALLAAQTGFECHLLLRGSEADAATLQGNLLLDHLAGAHVHVYEESYYRRHFRQMVEKHLFELEQAGKKPYWIDTGGSDAVGLWGYVKACEELRADFSREHIVNPYIVCADGSGGTHAGLIAGNQLHGLHAEIIGINVCDDEAYFRKKIGRDLAQWNERFALQLPVADWPIRVIDGYVGEGYAKAHDELLAMIADIARIEGVIFDPVYTGKAFYGMLSEIAQGNLDDADDIVFVHTGGIFGLAPFAEQFKRVLF